MTDVVVYGPAGSYGSFRIVAQGIAEGLIGCGLDCKLVEFIRGEVPQHDGIGAPIGIMCGPGDNLQLLALFGHEHRWAMVAPNSNWLPPALLEAINQFCTEVLTPSGWGRKQLRNCLSSQNVAKHFRVIVAPHGVTSQEKQTDVRVSPVDDRIKLLHLAESSSERKGTKILIKALAGEEFGNVHLTIVASHMEAARLSDIADEMYPGARRITVTRRWAVSAPVMRCFYRQFDAVIQPSRAEGFGMVPLEALCAGVPSIATDCTGHSEWALAEEEGPFGLIRIKSGRPSAVSYDPSGVVPTVQPEEIQASIRSFIERKDQWQSRAENQSKSLTKAWEWKAALSPLARRVKEIMG